MPSTLALFASPAPIPSDFNADCYNGLYTPQIYACWDTILNQISRFLFCAAQPSEFTKAFANIGCMQNSTMPATNFSSVQANCYERGGPGALYMLSDDMSAGLGKNVSSAIDTVCNPYVNEKLFAIVFGSISAAAFVAVVICLIRCKMKTGYFCGQPQAEGARGSYTSIPPGRSAAM